MQEMEQEVQTSPCPHLKSPLLMQHSVSCFGVVVFRRLTAVPLTATYMELTQTSITLSETVILNKIKVRRRGSLQRTTSVQCVLKGVTATGGSSTDNITDFFVPQEPEMVTFEPDSNQTGEFLVPPCLVPDARLTVCLIFLINDQRYEGVESLLLTLQLPEDEPGVKLTSDLHMATVYITDEEDRKSVTSQQCRHFKLLSS